MRTYNLYLKKIDNGAELKKLIRFAAPKNMSIQGLIDVANFHLSNVTIIANLQIQKEDGEVALKTIPLKLKKITMWQYFDNQDMLVGVTNTVSNLNIPELRIFVFLKEVNNDN